MSDGKKGKQTTPQKTPKQTKTLKQTKKPQTTKTHNPPLHQSANNTSDAKAMTCHLPLADWCPASLWATATMTKLSLSQFSCRTWLYRVWDMFLVNLIGCPGCLLPNSWPPQHSCRGRGQCEGQRSPDVVWALLRHS